MKILEIEESKFFYILIKKFKFSFIGFLKVRKKYKLKVQEGIYIEKRVKGSNDFNEIKGDRDLAEFNNDSLVRGF